MLFQYFSRLATSFTFSSNLIDKPPVHFIEISSSSQNSMTYKVLSHISKVSYQLDLLVTTQIYHLFHVSLLKKHNDKITITSPILRPTGPPGQLLLQPLQIMARYGVQTIEPISLGSCFYSKRTNRLPLHEKCLCGASSLSITGSLRTKVVFKREGFIGPT